ncbi:hypothetical protein NDU88_006395 [Pleurodeles waltl]|uniref:Uncharacterized protein n=1 Tax=Pleurodeles waltl TaxID=8319 RepID=A0AAV7MC42_PLEWA|nr:hypothetical protein NDU88_006395 [Pleurodeles waltl]
MESTRAEKRRCIESDSKSELEAGSAAQSHGGTGFIAAKVVEAKVDDAVAKVKGSKKMSKSKHLDKPGSSDPGSDSSLFMHKAAGGKYISSDELSLILDRIRVNLDFEPSAFTEHGEMFRQYFKLAGVALPLYPMIKKSIFQGWNEPDHFQVPNLMLKAYVLEKEEDLPHSVKVDTILAPLIRQSTLSAENCSPSDQLHRKIDEGMKKSFVAANLALRVASYAALTSQSLVKHFEILSDALQEGSDISPLGEH